jgi:non-heme chloroperoxidase
LTNRRSFLQLSLPLSFALAASSTAVTLPHTAQGQGRTFGIKTRDGIGLFVKDSGGSGGAVVMTHAWPLNADV